MTPGLPSGSPASHAALHGSNSIGAHLNGISKVDQDQGEKRGSRPRMADQGYPLLEELVARAKPDINIHAPVPFLYTWNMLKVCLVTEPCPNVCYTDEDIAGPRRCVSQASRHVSILQET